MHLIGDPEVFVAAERPPDFSSLKAGREGSQTISVLGLTISKASSNFVLHRSMKYCLKIILGFNSEPAWGQCSHIGPCTLKGPGTTDLSWVV